MQKKALKYVKEYTSFKNLLKTTEKIFLLIKDILESQKRSISFQSKNYFNPKKDGLKKLVWKKFFLDSTLSLTKQSKIFL